MKAVPSFAGEIRAGAALLPGITPQRRWEPPRSLALRRRRETRALVPDDTVDLLRAAVRLVAVSCSIQPGTGGSIHIHVPGRLAYCRPQYAACYLLLQAIAATGTTTHTGYIHNTAGGKGLRGVPLPLLHPSALLITCITQGNNGGAGHGR